MNLPKDQIETLQRHFRISMESPLRAGFQSVEELLNPVNCRRYLQQIAGEFHTSSLPIVASQFSKRYISMVAPPTLYAMSVYEKGLLTDPENCYIVSAYNDRGSWFPQLALSDWEASEATLDRVTWKGQVARQLFSENITPLWEVLHNCTGIQTAVLWENTAVYIHRLYRKTLAEHPQAQLDYQYLVHTLTPDLFGSTFHPLQRFRLTDGGRETCCLYFLTNEEKKYCKSCPRARVQKRSMVTM